MPVVATDVRRDGCDWNMGTVTDTASSALGRRGGALRTPRLGWWRLPVLALTVAALALGAALRGWLAFHQPVNADEATVGLMARQILGGHFVTFFWGQQYGGTEAYVVAAVFGVFGQSPVLLKLTAAGLDAVSAVLVWRIARHLVKSRLLAVVAGTLAWVAPASSVAASSAELGFRGVTLAASLGCLLACIRLLDGSRRWYDPVAAGLLAGLAWWSSPECVYLLLPAVLVLVAAGARGLRAAPRAWAGRLVVTLVAAGVGAMPWLWANIHSGFASLRPAAFGGTSSAVNPGYVGRLATFFRYTVPMQMGFRIPWWGRWVFGGPRAPAWDQRLLLALGAAVGLVFAVCIALCVVRGGRCLALVAAVAAFPFLYAYNPGTWFWQDGRYALYLGPLLALLLTTGLGELGERVGALGERLGRIGAVALPRAGLPVAALALCGAAVLSTAGLAEPYHLSATRFFSNWSNPNDGAVQAVDRLEAVGIDRAYAGYWIAYKLDFSADGHLALATVPPDIDPWPPYARAVQRTANAAWLFVPPAQAAEGMFEFGSVTGPSGYDERAFEGMLEAHRIAYRVVKAGLLQAVIPSATVTAADLHPPAPRRTRLR